MDFKKRLKTRLYVGIVYIILGIAIIVCELIINTENSFISALGFAMIVMGLVRIRNHRLITRNEETLKRQEIAETDERNISIVHKARSMAFTIYIVLACLTVIELSLIGLTRISAWISYSVALLVQYIGYAILYIKKYHKNKRRATIGRPYQFQIPFAYLLAVLPYVYLTHFHCSKCSAVAVNGHSRATGRINADFGIKKICL